MRVSNSQLGLFNECNRKWVHKYVLKTPPDFIEEKKAFFYGNLMHKMLEIYIKKLIEKDKKEPILFTKVYEETLKDKRLNEEYKSFIEEAYLDVEPPLLAAKMYTHFNVFSNFLNTNAGKIEFVASEHTIENELIKLVIDAIFIFEDKFYIVDFKTTSTDRYKSFTKYRLHEDPQLALYATFRDELLKQIPAIFNKELGGVCYFEFYKNKETWCKKTKSIDDYYNKVLAARGGDLLYITLAKKEDIQEKTFRDNFLATYADMKLVKVEAEEKGNFGIMNRKACISPYGDKCEFWSQCYADVKNIQFNAEEPFKIADEQEDLLNDLLNME